MDVCYLPNAGLCILRGKQNPAEVKLSTVNWTLILLSKKGAGSEENVPTSNSLSFGRKQKPSLVELGGEKITVPCNKNTVQ